MNNFNRVKNYTISNFWHQKDFLEESFPINTNLKNCIITLLIYDIKLVNFLMVLAMKLA